MRGCDVSLGSLQVKDYTVLNPVNVEAIAGELAHQILFFFSFAFIGYNPCVTIWVYHGIFTAVLTIHTIYQFTFKVSSQYLGGTFWSVSRV